MSVRAPGTKGSSTRDQTFAAVGRILGGAAAGGPASTQGAVVVANGRIVEIAAPASLDRLPARRYHAAFVAPGFVDLQVNGAFGYEVGDDPQALRALAARLPETGVTTFLPALVSLTEDGYRRAFAAFDQAVAAPVHPAAARIAGLHLEGPLLAATRAGAHVRAAIDAADAALVDRLADSARVRLVTLAPEREAALPLIARLRSRGIVVAMGHTDATFETFTAGVDAGATLATHLFNAMSSLHHRAPGAVGAALADERVVATIVADGIHTHPAAFKLAFRAKGPHGLALVTDAIAAAGVPPGPARLAGLPVTTDGTSARLADGTLAGSLLMLDQAVRNAIAFASLTPEVAVALATAVPARAVQLADRGTLTVGGDADLVLLGDDLNVERTFVGGLSAYARNGEP